VKAAFRLRSPHDRAIAALAIPALGSLIADPVLSLVDTAFIGRVGGDALAGLGVASAVFAVAFFIFNFLEYGTTMEVARSVGAGDLSSAGRATLTSFRLAALSGVGVSVLLLLFAVPIAALLGAEGAVRSEAVTYVMIRGLAAPAVLVVRAAHGAYRGFQDTRTPFVVTLGINGVNLALDPFLIFGLGLGVAGAAWATLVAQWIGAAVFIGLFWRGRERFGLSGAKPVLGEVRRFLRVGRDLAVRSGALLATFTVATAVATRVSDDAVGAHQILSQVFLFLALGVDALAIAAQAMVGKALGAGDRSQLVAVTDRLLALGAVIGLAIAGVLAVLSPFLSGWFTNEPGVLVEVAGAYWLLVALQPLGALAFVWDGVFIGLGDVSFLAVAMVISSGAALVILALVLPLGWGLGGVWAALNVLMGMRVLTLGWRRWGARSPLRLG
jgi:MATE family multidrug resistance protein